MTEQFEPEGKTSMADFPMSKLERFERFIRNQIANELEQQATSAMISDEYNFNDTAVRAKTFYRAAQIARGKND